MVYGTYNYSYFELVNGVYNLLDFGFVNDLSGQVATTPLVHANR